MIVHIVMWNFDDKDKEQNMDKFRGMLLKLPPIISEIKHMEVGKDVNYGSGNYDMVLVSKFESMDDLQKYKSHPEHLKVSKFCSSIRTERACVDYEISRT